MGDIAAPVRLLSARLGSRFTYAPIEHATAPGQVSFEEAKKLYRADRIDRRTRVYGVIGDPIGHSLSPILQNAGFAARRMNAVYLPFLVHDLKDFLGAIEPLGLNGFSITIPHKERILRYLDGCDPLAGKIGAVNTVVVRGKGKLYGYNTDYVGVLRTLQTRIPLQNSRVLIVGAGGVARAVAFALAEAGSSVCVCARRMERAKSLARAVGGETIARKQLRGEFFDAIVNATPLGMHPNTQQSPLDEKELNCRLVFDTIYRPRQTQLAPACRAPRHSNGFRGGYVRGARHGAMGNLDRRARAPGNDAPRGNSRAGARRESGASATAKRKERRQVMNQTINQKMIQPDFKEFSRLAKQGNLVPGL